MPPAYRNPNNDPPRLGEIIHYYGGHYESPAIISDDTAKGGHKFPITVFRAAGQEVLWVTLDEYDPTEEPAPYTWHFGRP